MSFDDWILALHVLSAFALVAGIIGFWMLIVAVRQADTPERTIRMGPVARVGNAAIGIGWVGTIVLGVWLAFSVGGYDIWDAWIIAAIVLWLIASAAGGPLTRDYRKSVGEGADSALAWVRSGRAAALHAVMAVATLLLLIDMIYKPGV